MQRELCGLTGCGKKQEQADQSGRALRCASYLRRYRTEVHRAELGKHDHHGRQQTHVANTVHDECLLSRRGVFGNVVPEANQQVGGQTNAFPTDEQDRVGVAEHEDQHGRDKEVQVGKEPAAVLVMFHVRNRVHVDERANESDQHDERH